MMIELLDSTVIIHLLRRYQPAMMWFDASKKYSISAITWMEVTLHMP